MDLHGSRSRCCFAPLKFVCSASVGCFKRSAPYASFPFREEKGNVRYGTLLNSPGNIMSKVNSTCFYSDDAAGEATGNDSHIPNPVLKPSEFFSTCGPLHSSPVESSRVLDHVYEGLVGCVTTTTTTTRITANVSLGLIGLD